MNMAIQGQVMCEFISGVGHSDGKELKLDNFSSKSLNVVIDLAG